MVSGNANDRFTRFVWLSMGFHLALLVVAFLIAHIPSDPPPNPPLTFELVGAPPKGVPGPPAAPAPAPETPPTPDPTPPTPPPPTTIPTLPTPTIPTNVKPVPANTSKPQSTTPSTGQKPTTLPVGPVSGVPTGDTLSVGGQGGQPSVMALWLSRVKFQVERNWSAPAGLPGVTAPPEVVFEVERDGKPGRPKLRVKSGNEMLDRLALRAVAAVDLFPPVPSSWQSKTVAVRYVLDYAH